MMLRQGFWTGGCGRVRGEKMYVFGEAARLSRLQGIHRERIFGGNLAPPLMKNVLTLASVFAMALPTYAQQVLMFDFGPTAVSGTSTVNSVSVNNTVNSPYHTVNTSFTGSTWNQVNTTDIAAGSLKFSDNSTATGISLNLGSATSGSTLVDLSTQPTSSALNTNVNATTTGVYGAGSVGKDATFVNSGGRIGVQIGGLSAGSYDVYVIARNTNLGTASTNPNNQTVYIGTSSTSGNFDFGSGFSSATLSYGSSASQYTSAWVQGENYVKFSIVLTSDQVLNLAVAGTPTGTGTETRGFLNTIQIVSAVPEPSAFAALAGLGALAFVVVRRRRR